MKKHWFAPLTALLLTVSLIGCSHAPLSETGRIELPAVGTTGSIPALTTPSYYTPPTPEQDETYTPEYQLQLLADQDFDGAVFLTVQEQGLENPIFPSADELIEVYADRRNRLVQEKYNVELACIQMTADEIVTQLSAAVAGGDYFCDLLVVSPSLLTRLQQKNLLVSLDTLPFFKTDSVCIRQDATAEINSAWSGIYGIWGDALRQPSRAYAVYYNRSMAEELSCPNFYSRVISGSWDWQALLTPAEQGGLIFDGDPSSLIFATAGLASATDEGAALLADPALGALTDSFQSYRYQPTEDESALDAFLAGKSLFYIGDLGDLEAFSQSELQVGLLPLPKYDSTAGSYPYLVDQKTLPLLACPANVAATAGTGILLSALNAASCDEVEEIFLQDAETKVRDNGSTLMLPYCIGSLHFDRKLIFGE